MGPCHAYNSDNSHTELENIEHLSLVIAGLQKKSHSENKKNK